MVNSFRICRNIFLAALTAQCFTTQDLKNAICRTLCRQDQHDDGDFKNNKCRCIDEIEYEVAAEMNLKFDKPKPRSVWNSGHN